MRNLAWLLAILVLTHATGCAILRTSSGDAAAQVDDYLSNQEYGKASAAVAALKASPSAANHDLQALQQRVDTRIAYYERQIIAKADTAAAENDWATAFDLYRAALTRLPESHTLQRGQQRLRQRHAAHLEALAWERLIAKAEWTLKDLELAKLAQAHDTDDWLGQYLLSRKRAAANELAREVEEQGTQALARHDLPVAKRLLSVAAALSNAAKPGGLRTQLEDTLRDEESRVRNQPPPIAQPPAGPQPTGSEKRREEERAAVKAQEQNTAKQLMADFKKACREKNLADAAQLRSQLEALGIDNREFGRLRKQLASEIAREVKHLTEVGATHYSQQQYEEALAVWQQAQVLDPKNEQLAARIKRATRVLDKLQRLRDKSAATQ